MLLLLLIFKKHAKYENQIDLWSASLSLLITSPQVDIPGGSALREVLIIFLSVWIYLAKQRSHRGEFELLSWASLIDVDMSCFACAMQENNPNIQSCFSQGSPDSLLCSYTTNHFDVRVTQGCNLTLIYHTWYEIKPEKGKPHENFSEWVWE